MDSAEQDARFISWGFGEFSDASRPPCESLEMHPPELWDSALSAKERLSIAWAHDNHPWGGWYELAHVVVCQLPVVVNILATASDEDTVEQVALFLRLRSHRFRSVRVPGWGQAYCVPAWRIAISRVSDSLSAPERAHLLAGVGDIPPDDEWFSANLPAL